MMMNDECQGRPTAMLEPASASAVDEVLTSVMDKLQALEQGQDLLLKTLQPMLSRVQGDVALIAHAQQPQRRQQQTAAIQQDALTSRFHDVDDFVVRDTPETGLKSPLPAENQIRLISQQVAPVNQFKSTIEEAPPARQTASVSTGPMPKTKACQAPENSEMSSTNSDDNKPKLRRPFTTSHMAEAEEEALEDMMHFASASQREKTLQAQKFQDIHGPRHLRFLHYISILLKSRKTRVLWEQTIDILAGVFIILNAIIMGFAMDQPDTDENPWFGLKCGFAAVFWMELILKVGIFGWRHQYCADNITSNVFDSFLILMDTGDILISVFKGQLPGGNSVLILRTFRLLRVVRIFRIFRSPVFRDLMSMLHALRAGSATLLWSIVFFMCFIYVASLLFRASFGPNPDEKTGTIDPATMEFYFQSVPRSMLTTYRCSFGDCSTKLGTPILESSKHRLGIAASLLLSFLLFLCTVGMFNIFAAVFLERIMTYESSKSHDRLRDRLNDKRLWYDNVSNFLDLQLQIHEMAKYDAFGDIEEESVDLRQWARERVGYKCLTKISQQALAKKSFSKQLLDFSVANLKEARTIMANLDIDTQDCLHLSDTLDRNQNGRIDVMELVSGLRRLRGPARRSDIVAVELTLQSVQEKLDDIWLNHQQQQCMTTERI